ncbi:MULTISPECIES: TAXI family TRAP transporter solute-binding subunit [Nitrincola]|uniref:TRAP transporter solute receptor, TAXI family n=1 Tax=Nitrincola nitratireducens TaxID=1229521 RepID=W9UXH3_9GAMM|nr:MULTISPECIES: TAXI family TRAP transporter solute-binding subunit [Nitrincola]EXJ09406.1 TRAP transporter solute receptor, TAXI family [Nitrincola nitratireducens]
MRVSQRLRLGVEYLNVILPFILLGVVLFAIAWPFVEPAPPERFTLSTGASGGAYEQTGHRYIDAFEQAGFELQVLPSAGSVENWQRLLRKEVDAALVQSGTLPEGQSLQDVQAVVSIALEPLWVFYRSSVIEPVERLSDLGGKRIAIGAEGSGTQRLVSALLDEVGMYETLTEGTELVSLGGREAVEALRTGEVDAAAFVMSPDAPLMTDLLLDPNLQVLDFKRAQAIARRLPYLTAVVLHQGVVDLKKNLPQRDIHLLAASTYLAIHRETHRSIVQLLIEAAKRDQTRVSLLAEPGYFPSLNHIDLPIASEADYFFQRGPNILHRHLPFWLASLVDRLAILIIPLLAIMIPLFRVAPPALRWRVRRRIYRWYKKLRVIDADLMRSDTPIELIRQDLKLVSHFEDDVANTEVPLSYMEEFYNLRLHVAYIRERLERRLAHLEDTHGTQP